MLRDPADTHHATDDNRRGADLEHAGDDQHDAGQVLMLKLGNAPDEPSGGHDDACADEDSAYAEKQLSAVVKGAKLAIERFTDAIEAVGPVRLDDALAFFFARQD